MNKLYCDVGEVIQVVISLRPYAVLAPEVTVIDTSVRFSK